MSGVTGVTYLIFYIVWFSVCFRIKINGVIPLQNELEKKSPLLLKLGLLFETGTDIASVRNMPTFLSFQHKIFQEYSGACFVTKILENSKDMQVN